MIEVKNVTKKYGKVAAVDNISFTIKEGEIIRFTSVQMGQEKVQP